MRNKNWLTELVAWILLITGVLVLFFIMNVLVKTIGPYAIFILILIYAFIAGR